MGQYDLDLGRYAQLARQAAAEGSVLLKNDRHALPLGQGERVAVFGRIQCHYYKSGTGSGGMVNTLAVPGILDALRHHPGVQVDQELAGLYERWVADHPFDQGVGWAAEPWCQEEMPLNDTQVARAARDADVALVVLGRTAGEDKDNSAVAGSYLLTDQERALLKKVCGAFPRTVVVLNVGNIIDLGWVGEYDPASVLFVWHGGQEGGNAVAELLTGTINPSGKLTDTVACSIEDYPAHGNFGDQVRNLYQEDIFVGYRHFETWAQERVLYPFGFGLSYTRFAVTTEFLSPVLGENTVRLKVRVTNLGAVVGREVVQVYSSAPQGLMGRPSRELRAFAKTPDLQPGASVDVDFAIPLGELAAYDDDGRTGHRSCFVLESGVYGFFVGTDVRSAQGVGTAVVPETQVVSRHPEALAPRLPFLRRHAQASAQGIEAVWEPAPTKTIDLPARIAAGRPSVPAFTGDRGFLLADVVDGRVSLDEFLAQLSDLDLIHLSRGEGMSSAKVTPGTAGAFGGVTDQLRAWGIPVGCCADGPSGIRMDSGALAFSLPNGTCLASTFDTDLVRDLYAMTGLELRRNRIDTILGPGINIHRHPLNGRNFEYFSEDPLVTGRMAVACLQGLHRWGVTGTIKHFAANNQELGRHTSDSVVSERALREIYLKGFEMAVREGKAQSVMTSYGAVNGLWTAGNYDLVTTILRGEWGFRGLVMTDWWARMNDEGEAEGSKQNAPYMVRAQNDLYMVTEDSARNTHGDWLEEGLAQGVVTRGELFRNAANICRVLMSLPVMARFLGRLDAEELNAAPTPAQDSVPSDLTYQLIDGAVSLDISNLKTDRGSSQLFGLSFARKGTFDLTLRVRSHSGELAQIPVSLFLDGRLVATVTVNGTGGRWIEETRVLGSVFSSNAYLKVAFAQGGLEVGDLKVTLRDEPAKGVS